MPGKFQVLSLVLILGFAGRLSAQVADPAPSPVLAYEGRLTESNVLVTGSRPFVFSIINTKGNELWNSGAQNLSVVEGLYGVVLGATGMPAIPASLTLESGLHLHVLVDGVALSPDIALIPALQASTSWSVTGPFYGDISGTQQGISVDKLKGMPIDLTGVTAGQVLTFDGTNWTASTAAGGQGSMGPPGAAGATGSTGPQGPQGVIGATGPQGPAGVAGTNGSGFNFLNAFDNSASYAIDDVVTFNGSTYVAIVASAGPANPTPVANASAWSVLAEAGAAGAAGIAGAPGSPGAPGATGPQGPAGATGAQGPAGATGATGPQGPQGVIGATGPQGPAGVAGTNGSGLNFLNAFNNSASYAIDDVVTFNGSTYVAIVASAGPANPTPVANPSAWSVMAEAGAAGTAGAPGSPGAAGATGPQGPAGATGATGPQGPQGVIGATGPQGPAGVAGTNGSGFNFLNAFNNSASYAIDDVVTFNGSTYVAIVASAGPANPTPVANPSAWSVMAEAGAAGAAGIAGAPGSPGAAGATGSQGPAGATGATGPQGPQGVIGATGPQGPAGVAGTNGSGFNFLNAFDNSASYAIDDVVTFNGSTYVAIVASAGPANPTPVANPSAWSVMAQAGAAGAAGIAGAPGSPGAAGATGPQGPAGATGAQGPAGASPFTLDGSNAVFTTGSVGIGIDPPNATAALDVTSTTKGLLAPRMTGAQRLAIASPANGLIVFDTAAKSLEVYDAVGTVWDSLGGFVTSVTGTSPILVATGTTTPAITLGTVPVADGGTGATALTGYLSGNGTTAVTASATIPSTAITGIHTVPQGGTGAGTLTGYVLASGTNNMTATPIIPVSAGGTGLSAVAAGAILFGNSASVLSTAPTALFWNPTLGYLGIGTSSPNYPIDVESSVSHTFSGPYGWLNTGGSSSSGGNVTGYFTLNSNGRIAAIEFDAISDARIKHVIGPSDTSLDLETLTKLKITDYRYIDVVEKGNQRKKGVIAQEVEKVYPDAVRIMSNFIPSVYAIAVDTAYNEASHELTVTAPKAHGFAAGDTVRIIVEGVGNVDRPVAATLGDDMFVLSGMEKAPPSQVFIFGKKVEDFRVVDYDQLFSMNIGATQQLAAENRDLKRRITALEQAVVDLQKWK